MLKHQQSLHISVTFSGLDTTSQSLTINSTNVRLRTRTPLKCMCMQYVKMYPMHYSNKSLSFLHQLDTAHICCQSPAMQQSINISWLSGPQQQTHCSCMQWLNDRTARQTDRWTPNSFTDPAANNKQAVSINHHITLTLLLTTLKR